MKRKLSPTVVKLLTFIIVLTAWEIGRSLHQSAIFVLAIGYFHRPSLNLSGLASLGLR